MGMNPPGNGLRADVENMKEDIREIKEALRDIIRQMSAQNTVVNNHWTARDAEIAQIRQAHAVFQARIVTIGGVIGVIWTIATIVAVKFL